MNNNFALLGLREGATTSEIRAAYLAAVKARHPDLARGELDRRCRTRDTAAINVAYTALRKSGLYSTTNSTEPRQQSVPTPPREWVPPAQTSQRPASSHTQVSAYEGVLPWLGPLAAAVVGGLLASSVAGNPVLCVVVMVAFVVVGRWPKAVEVLR